VSRIVRDLVRTGIHLNELLPQVVVLLGVRLPSPQPTKPAATLVGPYLACDDPRQKVVADQLERLPLRGRSLTNLGCQPAAGCATRAGCGSLGNPRDAWMANRN
jgi:hypothetical protein